MECGFWKVRYVCFEGLNVHTYEIKMLEWLVKIVGHLQGIFLRILLCERCL